MRLTRKEILCIREVLGRHRPVGDFQLYLTGSRADDRARGGDVDLLLVTADEASSAALRDRKERLLVELKERLGDQRIDLTIVDERRVSEHPVLSAMRARGVRLDDGR